MFVLRKLQYDDLATTHFDYDYDYWLLIIVPHNQVIMIVKIITGVENIIWLWFFLFWPKMIWLSNTAYL